MDSRLVSSPGPAPLRVRHRAAALSARPSVLLYEAHPYLSGVPDILAGLTPLEEARVSATGREMGFAAGEHLFRQGERHEGIFVVRTGVVRSLLICVEN